MDQEFATFIGRVREERSNELRSDCTQEEFDFVVNTFFKTIVPNTIWNRNHSNIALSLFFTVADETFALLCLENSVEEWSEQIEKTETKNTRRKKGDKLKWTGPSKATNNRGAKRGWSIEGRERYNELFMAIVNERKKKESKSLEDSLLETLKKEGQKNEDDKHDKNDENYKKQRDRKERMKNFRSLSGFDF